jgi:hypothetical protein
LSLKYNVLLTASKGNSIINAMVLVASKPTSHCRKTCHIIKTYQRIKTLVMSTTIAKPTKLVIGVIMQHVKPTKTFIEYSCIICSCLGRSLMIALRKLRWKTCLKINWL